jgi:hypothetical protein
MFSFQIGRKRIYLNCIFLKIRPSHLLSDMCEIYLFLEGENEYCCPLGTDILFFFTIKSTEALISKFIMVRNSTCFGQCPCPSLGVFHCTFGTGTSYKCLSTICVQNQEGTLYILDQCRIYSGKLLMMGRDTARNM